MKSKALSSRSTGRRHRLGCRMPLSVCTPRPHPSFRGKLVEPTLAWRNCRPGNSATTVHCGRGQETAPGGRGYLEMLKMKQPPGMCMKTNGKMTIFPTQKTTFLPGCTPFCRKVHLFCRDSRRFAIIQSLEDELLASNCGDAKSRTPFAPPGHETSCFYDERSQNVVENTW